jgi:hypoxanthine phosphoribosyltransferase
MADSAPRPRLEQILGEDEVRWRVDALAEAMAPSMDGDTIAVCLLTGGLWFAADLTRALSRLGVNPGFDALWLASYGDGLASQGRVEVRAPLQRSVYGRKAVILDDVYDTGLSLGEAVKIVRGAGATEVLTAVFARKPAVKPRPFEPDFVAWEAPSRYLVGYGLDAAGAMRTLPGVWAVAD